MPDQIKFKNRPLKNNSPLFDKEVYGDLASTLIEASSSTSIYNVGIIAGFSSGKSSLIETFYRLLPPFQKGESGKRILSQKTTRFISVADFEATQKGQKKEQKDGDSTGEGLDSQRRIGIESEIVKQLLFSVSSRMVPSSRIDRIQHFTWRALLTWVFLFIGLIFLSFGLLTGYGVFPFGSLKGNQAATFSFYLIAALSFSVFFVFLSLIFPIKKVSFSAKGLSADGEKPIDAGLMDRYFDELVYLFRKTKINLVIFEDIDRFRDVQLLLDVRALNFELNRDPIIQKRGGIAFIYAINESLHYKAEDQAKFFDITLPVIPALNPYNSAETFLGSEIMKGELCPEKEEVLLLSRHVSDKRMANEIIDDYLIYYESNKDAYHTQIDINALFALMVYKHIAPRDFARAERAENKSFLSRALDPNETGPDEKDPDPVRDSFLKDIVSAKHRYISFDYLRYISHYSSELFPNRCDRDFYEKVVKRAGYGDIDFSLKDPASLFDLIPSQYFGDLSCLDFDFVDEIIRRACREGSARSEKILEFFNFFKTSDDKMKEFLVAYDAHCLRIHTNNMYFFIKIISVIAPWLFSFMASSNFETTDRKLLCYYASTILFKTAQNTQSALDNPENSNSWPKFNDFFSSTANPSDAFSEASPDAFNLYIASCHPRILCLEKLSASPIADSIIAKNAYQPTIENFKVILGSYFQTAPQNHELFTSLKQTKNIGVFSYAILDFPSLVKEWVSSGFDFGNESPEVVQEIVNNSSAAITEDSLSAFLGSVAEQEKVSFETIADRRVKLVYESDVLPSDINEMGRLYSQHQYKSLLLSLLLRRKDKIPEPMILDVSGKNFLNSIMTDPSYSYDSKALAAILKKTDFPAGPIPSNFSKAGIEALIYSGKADINAANMPYICKSDAAFLYCVEHDFDSVIGLPSLSPVANAYQAEILFHKCKSEVDKKKVFQSLGSKLDDEKLWKEIKPLIDENANVNSKKTMQLILEDRGFSFELKCEIILKNQTWANPNEVLALMSREYQPFFESFHSNKPFPVSSTSSLNHLCHYLATYGYLVSAGTDSTTGNTNYIVPEACRQKEKQ